MKNKKLTALLTASVMMLGVWGCGAQSESQSAQVQESAEVTAEVTVEETASDAAAEASSEEKVEETVQEGPLTVTDMIGREVEVVPGSYQRVVCIGAGALRLYSYVGDVSLLCGVEDIDNSTLEERPKMFDSVARPYVLAYADTFNTLDSCGVGGPNAQAAEAEKILSCNPDIVISEYEDEAKEDALQEQLGVPVITLKTGPKGVFDDAFDGTMTLLGTIFGTQEKAEKIIAYVDEQEKEISDRTKDIADDDKPSVYVCGLGNWGTTNHLMTAQNYVLFNIANVKNAVTDLEKDGIQEIEEEKFVALGDDIDIMIMDAAAVKNIKPLFQEDKTMFDSCKAWNDGEVYLEMAYNAYYTNYEIALANTWFIAKSVYPDAFEDVDMTEKTNEIMQVFYGKDLADQIFACPSSFGGYQKIDTASFFE